jgi:hypothetical protein
MIYIAVTLTVGMTTMIQAAEPDDDGLFTIHFECGDDGRQNCIPITPAWNCAIRMYEPREAIPDGKWTFPAIEPAS